MLIALTHLNRGPADWGKNPMALDTTTKAHILYVTAVRNANILFLIFPIFFPHPERYSALAMPDENVATSWIPIVGALCQSLAVTRAVSEDSGGAHINEQFFRLRKPRLGIALLCLEAGKNLAARKRLQQQGFPKCVGMILTFFPFRNGLITPSRFS